MTSDKKDNKWQFDLEQYIIQGEPDETEKSIAWKTAIGLQDVDGLKTSEYLLNTAKEHIEGKINIKDAKQRIESYYKQQRERKDADERTEEADIVAVRITELLSEKTFNLSPVELKAIHKRLFTGILKNAGSYRTYNITKNEWVLNGETVLYAAYDSIQETLEYDFTQEKKFSYEGLTIHEAIKHIVQFVSGIWQIHPFCEGNTRTTAVFIIKYLHTFGFTINNDVFAEKSWYFRNALVRANYNNLQENINETTEFLELFFENFLMSSNHNLKNRYLHINYNTNIHEKMQANINVIPVENTLNCNLEEYALLKLIQENPLITQKEMATLSGKSERTIKRRTMEMQEKGLIMRENGKRRGKWVILNNK